MPAILDKAPSKTNRSSRECPDVFIEGKYALTAGDILSRKIVNSSSRENFVVKLDLKNCQF